MAPLFVTACPWETVIKFYQHATEQKKKVEQHIKISFFDYIQCHIYTDISRPLRANAYSFQLQTDEAENEKCLSTFAHLCSDDWHSTIRGMGQPERMHHQYTEDPKKKPS